MESEQNGSETPQPEAITPEAANGRQAQTGTLQPSPTEYDDLIKDLRQVEALLQCESPQETILTALSTASELVARLHQYPQFEISEKLILRLIAIIKLKPSLAILQRSLNLFLSISTESKISQRLLRKEKLCQTLLEIAETDDDANLITASLTIVYNVLCDHKKLRATFIQQGALKMLADIAQGKHLNVLYSVLAGTAAAVRQQFKELPVEQLDDVWRLLLALTVILKIDNSEQFLVYCIAVIASLTSHASVCTGMIEAQLLPLIFSSLLHEKTSVVIPALRAIGNMLICEEDSITQRVFEAGVLNHLQQMLERHNSTPVSREIALALYNLSVRSPERTNAILNRPELMQILIERLDSECAKTSADIALTLSKLIINSGDINEAQRLLAGSGLVRRISSLLFSSDEKILGVAADALAPLVSYCSGNELKEAMEFEMVAENIRAPVIRLVQQGTPDIARRLITVVPYLGTL